MAAPVTRHGRHGARSTAVSDERPGAVRARSWPAAATAASRNADDTQHAAHRSASAQWKSTSSSVSAQPSTLATTASSTAIFSGASEHAGHSAAMLSEARALASIALRTDGALRQSKFVDPHTSARRRGPGALFYPLHSTLDASRSLTRYLRVTPCAFESSQTWPANVRCAAVAPAPTEP